MNIEQNGIVAIMNERTGITELKGIGEKTGALFHKLGISTVGELLRYYPRGYDVYEEPVPISELEEGRVQTITGAIWGKVQVSPNRRMPVTTVQIKDISGTIKAMWFRMPFLRSTFTAFVTILFVRPFVNGYLGCSVPSFSSYLPPG